VASIIVFVLLIWTGIINKLTSGILKLLRKTPVNEEILHQAGDYGIIRIKITEKDRTAALTIGNSKFKKPGITILAIERGDKVVSLPKDNESVQAGDHLLCYGKVDEFSSL
jgi:uncharacterized protein with PhoU and TrkA domain